MDTAWLIVQNGLKNSLLSCCAATETRMATLQCKWSALRTKGLKSGLQFCVDDLGKQAQLVL
jgi:hypothetical protein